MGLRRRITVDVDDSRGVRGWQLVYRVLPATLDGPVQTDSGDIESRAHYVWNFYQARKGGSTKSFLITCPLERKNYLVEFSDSQLTFQMFGIRLYSSGVGLIQVDEPDVPTLEDGSVGEQSDNPDKI
jgi:hypothetical protein